MHYKTVREGQQALIVNHLGEGRVVIGPCRVFLYRERFQLLNTASATQLQYLVIRHQDGEVEHRPGPCRLYVNPLEHKKVTVKDMVPLDANEMLVVYNQEGDSIKRRIVQGPLLFSPSAHEWLHEFTWHGPDKDDKARMIPGSNIFNKLRVVPEHFYYNVREVRTKDDVTLRVKLMIFYELIQVETMLTQTHDPIADFVNAVCSDVIAFAATISYEDFLKLTHKLSDLATYSQLATRSERIGYTVTKVVYRGYHASEALQTMHDNGIKSRTELRLNTELEEMRQKTEQMKLSKEVERVTRQQEKESADKHHQHALERAQASAERQCKELMHQSGLDKESQWAEACRETAQAARLVELEYLQGLQKLGVDLTRYLVKKQSGNAVDEEIRMVKEK